MNDQLKDNLQSLIRAGVNLFAGTNIVSSDNMHKAEAVLLALLMVVWTICDNRSRANKQ